jgi:folate-dependent phosphoribosylglycinamide formyltransferase PurN
MRIVFLSVDDEFAGSMQKYIFQRHPEWIVGSVISTCAIYKKSRIGATLFILEKSGFRYGAEMFKMKVIRKLTQNGTQILPSLLAKEHSVETFYSANINEEQSLTRLKAWSPDFIISTNFSHYIGEKVRNMPARGAWNLHKSFLPNYRGIAPSFYALLHGEKSVGVTLHKLAKGFDTGDIVRQVSLPIQTGDTVYSLNQKTSDAGGRMMADVLKEAANSTPVLTPQPDGDWPNYTYPNRADIRAFLGKGLRF